MTFSIRNLLYAGVAALGIGVAAAKTDCLDQRLRVELEDRVIDINAYNPVKLWDARCALRAREIANEHFGKAYSAGAAWDRKYLDTVVARGDDVLLDELVSKKVLAPGMLVGMHNPHSPYLDGVDMHDKQKEFTHIVVYLGKGKDKKARFAHQYGLALSIRSEAELRDMGFKPLYVFDDTR